MQAHFFVENASIAFALKNVGGKICDKNNEKVSIKGMTRTGQGKESRTGARSA